MMLVMHRMFSHPQMRSLSALFVNLAAGWFATVFILPIQGFAGRVSFSQLTVNMFYGIVCLLVSMRMEELLDV